VVAGFLQVPGNASYAVRTRRHKLIVQPLPEGKEWSFLFDLGVDPHETTNLVPGHMLLAARLRGIPATLGLMPASGSASAPPSTAPPHIDPDVERELRSLGYVP
jgi:hypothetical protein